MNMLHIGRLYLNRRRRKKNERQMAYSKENIKRKLL